MIKILETARKHIQISFPSTVLAYKQVYLANMSNGFPEKTSVLRSRGGMKVPETKCPKKGAVKFNSLKQQVQSQQRVKHIRQLSNECLASLAIEYQVDSRAGATAKGMTSLSLICIAMRCHKGIKSETAMLFLTHALFCCDVKQTAF